MDDRIGFGKRLGAAVIDGIIIMVGGSIVGSIFGGLLGGAAGAGSGEEGAMAMGGVMGAVLGAAVGVGIVGVLYGLIEAFKAASPGKMILKIKIGTAEGADASTAQLFQRYAMKNSSNICTLLALVSCQLSRLCWSNNMSVST